MKFHGSPPERNNVKVSVDQSEPTDQRNKSWGKKKILNIFIFASHCLHVAGRVEGGEWWAKQKWMLCSWDRGELGQDFYILWFFFFSPYKDFKRKEEKDFLS